MRKVRTNLQTDLQTELIFNIMILAPPFKRLHQPLLGVVPGLNLLYSPFTLTVFHVNTPD